MVEKSYITNDNRFEFVFKFYVTRDNEEAAADVEIYYIDDEEHRRAQPEFIFLGADNNQQVAFDIFVLDKYILKGYIMPVFKDIAGEQEISCSIEGKFDYGDKDDIQNFIGEYLLSDVIIARHPKPSIVEDESRLTNIVIEHKNHNDLFPYVYMRKWPGVNEEFVKYNFIMYKRSDDDTLKLLIDKLIEDNNNRKKMNQDAIDYIEDSKEEEIAYLKDLNILSNKDIFNEPINLFYQYSLELILPIHYSPMIYKEKLLVYFDTSEEKMKEVLTKDNTYEKYKELCWQSYFALIFVLGYDQRKIKKLTKLLRVCYMLELLFCEENIVSKMDNNELNRILNATICLPKDLFGIYSDNKHAGIIPYAIGKMHLVKQKLDRYEFGEVSDIITVLKGEIKEIKNREHQRNETVIEETNCNNIREIYNTVDDQAGYINEVNHAVGEHTMTADYRSLKVAYNPNNIIYDGEITYDEPDNILEFGKKITTEAASKINKKISSIRRKIASHETENIITSRIDNTNSMSDIFGIYRWVDKVYKNYVINNGQKLMYEIAIEKPASQFIEKSLFLKGESLNFPISPLELGIEKYTDIVPNRECFSKLYLHYNKITPPPEITIEINDNLTGISSKIIKIPKDYEATSAKAILILTNDEDYRDIKIAIGTSIIQPAIPTKSKLIDIDKTSDQIILSVTGIKSNDYIVNVQITCCWKEDAKIEWQASTYKNILEQYKSQMASYYKQIEMQYGHSRSDWNAQLVKDAMIRNCKHVIYQNYFCKTNQETEAKEFDAEYRILQNINMLFEWDKMYFAFSESLKNDSSKEHRFLMDVNVNYGEVFNQFLMADFARVILPVRSGYELMAILFIDTGLIWEGHENNCCSPSDATTNNSPLEITASIKSNDQTEPSANVMIKSWETKLATGMQMLDSKYNVSYIRGENEDE